jgi:hypothetical protein
VLDPSGLIGYARGREEVSIKTMLRIASVAGITAMIHFQAAKKPKIAPKVCWRYGYMSPRDEIQPLGSFVMNGY